MYLPGPYARNGNRLLESSLRHLNAGEQGFSQGEASVADVVHFHEIDVREPSLHDSCSEKPIEIRSDLIVDEAAVMKLAYLHPTDDCVSLFVGFISLRNFSRVVLMALLGQATCNNRLSRRNTLSTDHNGLARLLPDPLHLPQRTSRGRHGAGGFVEIIEHTRDGKSLRFGRIVAHVFLSFVSTRARHRWIIIFVDTTEYC